MYHKESTRTKHKRVCPNMHNKCGTPYPSSVIVNSTVSANQNALYLKPHYLCEHFKLKNITVVGIIVITLWCFVVSCPNIK